MFWKKASNWLTKRRRRIWRGKKWEEMVPPNATIILELVNYPWGCIEGIDDGYSGMHGPCLFPDNKSGQREGSAWQQVMSIGYIVINKVIQPIPRALNQLPSFEAP
jgi:hypothetical protein